MKKFFLFALVSVSFYSLADYDEKNLYSSVPALPTDSRSRVPGKTLALKHCATCHLFPKPSLLDKKTWSEGVLPDMGRRMGLELPSKFDVSGMDDEDIQTINAMNIYPDSPTISKADWDAIVDYYLQNAPDKMPTQKKSMLQEEGKFPFMAQSVSIGDNMLPQVTLLEYDNIRSELYIGDYTTLYVLTDAGQIGREWKLDSPASDILFQKSADPMLLSIGKLKPSDQKLGKLSELNTSQAKPGDDSIISGLRRPVSFTCHDLNGNGTQDALICSFGHHGGQLAWYENSDPTKEHVLSSLPGARKTEIQDLNGDGLPDVVALMTQAFEQIGIYYNLGEGKFDYRPVLDFSPVHGTGYFELHDFNSDGYQDLLVTNGDNRDYSPVAKPYHGIRIYLNDGNDSFEEAYFYPMYDCHKAMARDFDDDGDLDIFATSLYSDYSETKNSKDAMVFLSNQGGLNFTPSFLPEPIHGNWLTMEVGDFNHDDRPDVALGTFINDVGEMVNVSTATGQSKFPQVLLLMGVQ